jgi:hypothetical protein
MRVRAERAPSPYCSGVGAAHTAAVPPARTQSGTVPGTHAPAPAAAASGPLQANNEGEGNVTYAQHNPFLANKKCLNQVSDVMFRVARKDS